jgi:hypothetical protein
MHQLQSYFVITSRRLHATETDHDNAGWMNTDEIKLLHLFRCRDGIATGVSYHDTGPPPRRFPFLVRLGQEWIALQQISGERFHVFRHAKKIVGCRAQSLPVMDWRCTICV